MIRTLPPQIFDLWRRINWAWFVDIPLIRIPHFHKALSTQTSSVFAYHHLLRLFINSLSLILLSMESGLLMIWNGIGMIVNWLRQPGFPSFLQKPHLPLRFIHNMVVIQLVHDTTEPIYRTLLSFMIFIEPHWLLWDNVNTLLLLFDLEIVNFEIIHIFS